MQYCFGDIVIVEGRKIGVIVDSWCGSPQGEPPSHDVYVRSYRDIRRYAESEIRRCLVRRFLYLDDAEMKYQENVERS